MSLTRYLRRRGEDAWEANVRGLTAIELAELKKAEETALVVDGGLGEGGLGESGLERRPL